jgi:endoglucanase
MSSLKQFKASGYLFLLIWSFISVINSVSAYSQQQKLPVDNTINADTSDLILINQLGFMPKAHKIALLRLKAEKFEIVNMQTLKTVYNGKTTKLKYWQFSEDSVAVADFSALKNAGKYKLKAIYNSKEYDSNEFTIADSIYHSIAKAAIKAYYLNRSGIAITPEYGGKWARAAGHPDTAVIIHASAASAKRPEGTVISCPGGWYDAGDYNKYPVNSSITTYTLLLFCQLYPEYINKLNTQIPESKNNIPDVMDELLYNLRWMLTMQDPNDGGVYHKLTNKGFDGWIMPSESQNPRYVVLKSTAATLDFASTMAMASRVFEKYNQPELKALSVTCKNAANKAYNWVNNNPVIYYKNPEDIRTGQYDDIKLEDENFWAHAELALTNNNPSLVSVQEMLKQNIIVPSWDTLGMLGVVSLALTDNKNFKNIQVQAQKVLIDYCDKLVHKADTSAYHISLDFFKWGSNSDVANMAMLKMIAYKITANKKYLNSAQNEISYLLGMNATGYSFVTGFGNKQAMNIHHRPSASDGVVEPYPGFLVGGPNIVTFNDCKEKNGRSYIPAKSYIDVLCSYSTNEVAINWNAPLFFILGAMDSLNY